MAEVAENNEEQQDEYSRLTGTQKCAILMMLLGEEEASEILRNLGPKEKPFRWNYKNSSSSFSS